MPDKNIYRKFFGSIGIIAALLLIHTLVSCEKEVHINLASTPPTLVIEGQIETGQPPFVVLTHSISYFSSVDLSTLENSFVHDATVKVATGSDTFNLREYSVDTGTSSKFYFFSLDTAGGLGNVLTGTVGKYYTLIVNYQGKTYSSVTKIPAVKSVDTIWADKPEFTNDKTPPTAKELYFNYTDPDTPGNYVRYFTKRNHSAYYPGEQVYTDEIINGTTIRNIGMLLGYDQNQKDINEDSLRYAFPGDTVTVKWCEIDKGVYTFWNSVAFSIRSGGNPFSSPINTVSNIKGGALGVWAGYNPAYYTLVVH